MAVPRHAAIGDFASYLRWLTQSRIESSVPVSTRENIMASSQRLASALFVDFDNFYSHLRDDDPQAAPAFAVSPACWIRWLENGLPGKLNGGQPRQMVARHCYLNPRQFGRFAGSFQHAGFQLVDCLTLSEQGTTTAQMVMGIFDVLSGGSVGEFVVVTTKPD